MEGRSPATRRRCYMCQTRGGAGSQFNACSLVSDGHVPQICDSTFCDNKVDYLRLHRIRYDASILGRYQARDHRLRAYVLCIKPTDQSMLYL